ncbi:MAG: amino acid adenylation domain-containing protein [Burkholderiales bacterium]|nr:amino acid adenylation domain-containing protein [Burkholderiales bacterium]
MTFSDLLLELGRRGVRVRRDGNDVKLRADKQALDPALLSSLREHKPALLDWIGPERSEWTVLEAPLGELSKEERERIAESIPGGISNIQDTYCLAPLQEGIFFHYLASVEGDPYLLPWLLAFDGRERLDRFTSALQSVIDRHDILRTSMAWEGLGSPVQVVWHQAPLHIEEVALPDDVGDVAEWLLDRFRRFRIDARRAPLMRAFVAKDRARERWLLMLLSHQLAIDHTSLDILLEEINAHVLGEAHLLPAPLPFRGFVARSRSAAKQASHEAFFRRMLADVDEPTLPFGFMDVRGDGSALAVATRPINPSLAHRLRECARALAVSPASVFHVAWALVMARLSGRDDVVFGTVIFGRMQAEDGASRVLGLCVNTLPVRIRVGSVSLEQAIRDTHAMLAELLSHEQAPLALAQRCSAVPAPTPLFSAGFNYRYSSRQRTLADAWDRCGMEELFSEERGNYPLHAEVDDFGDGFTLTTHVHRSVDPMRIAVYMENALAGVADLVQREPLCSAGSIDILPADERRQLIEEWNATESPFPEDRCIHELFEDQVQRVPEATAVVFEGKRLSYAELNARANRLARHLIALGVGPDSRVAIALPRGPAMLIAVLAALKAGGAYVPMDITQPRGRLELMLCDSTPSVLLTLSEVRASLDELPHPIPVVELDAAVRSWDGLSSADIAPATLGLNSSHLAYVIYTSGSTGMPKGVMVEHRALCHSTAARRACYGVPNCMALVPPMTFDASVGVLFWTLCTGSTLVVPTSEQAQDPRHLRDLVEQYRLQFWLGTPALYDAMLSACEPAALTSLRGVIIGGETPQASVLEKHGQLRGCPTLYGEYGLTETTVWSVVTQLDASNRAVIGKPIANVRVYILDAHGQPAPIDVAGEVHIGGAGVARGYLNRPALTELGFVPDPFDSNPRARAYKTGDLARWRADGTIEYVGRTDHQVKILGFRIELGEIEACLGQCPDVGEALVLAREDASGDRWLVAYYTAPREVDGHVLRDHLARHLPHYMVPGAYVQLANLPLTPNGKIDRSALPDPDVHGIDPRGYAGPVGALEKALVGIWAQVLHRAPEEIGRRDNFFDLGGHSLRIVQVAGLLQRSGFDLPAAALFAHPTIEELARHLSTQTDPTTARGAIPFRVKPESPPLFLVHEVWGEVLYGPALVAHIDPRFSVYGLCGRDAKEKPIVDFREHAASLLETMRAVQPSGPYFIAGWSFGGVLAYEMGRQLLDSGEQVAFIGLLDTANPSTAEIDLEAEANDQVRLLSALEPIGDPVAAAHLAHLAETATFDELIKAAQHARLLPARMSAEQVKQYLAHYDAYVRALIAYRPLPVDMAIHLFRVSDGRDPWLGWDRLLPEESIHVDQVPGSHQSMVASPHVESLGQLVSRALLNSLPSPRRASATASRSASGSAA